MEKRRFKSPNLLGVCINNTMNGKKVIRHETRLWLFYERVVHMPSAKTKDNCLTPGVLLSSEGKHNCKQCNLSDCGFCKPIGKFGYLVSDSECDRAKRGKVIVFKYQDVTKEFILRLAKSRNMTIEEFGDHIYLKHNTVKSLKTDKPLTTVQKKMYCERLNKYF